MKNPFRIVWHSKGKTELTSDQLIWQLISQLWGPCLVPGIVYIVRSVNHTHILLPFSINRLNHTKTERRLFRLLVRMVQPFPNSYFHLIHYSNCLLEPGLLLNWLAKEYGVNKIPFKVSLSKLHHYYLSNINTLKTSFPYIWLTFSLKILLEIALFKDPNLLLPLCEYYSLLWLKALSFQGFSIKVQGTLFGIQRSQKLFIKHGKFPQPSKPYCRPIITKSGCVNVSIRIS